MNKTFKISNVLHKHVIENYENNIKDDLLQYCEENLGSRWSTTICLRGRTKETAVPTILITYETRNNYLDPPDTGDINLEMIHECNSRFTT
jgi:hypothetical protein